MNKKYEEMLGYSFSKVQKLYRSFKNERKKNERICKVLDAIDRGEFWSTVGKKALPGWTIKPDTNHINIIKTNYCNSLYVGAYRANVFPKSGNDKGKANSINEFLDYKMNQLNIPYLQLKAGDRAALLNYSALEFSWNPGISDGVSTQSFGDLDVRMVDNMSLYLDPNVNDYLKGRAIFIEEETSIVDLSNNPRYIDRLKEYIKLKQNNEITPSGDDIARYIGSISSVNTDTVNIVTCYYKYFGSDVNKYRIDQIVFINEGFIIDAKVDIKPRDFPVRVLYCNLPTDGPYGVSTPKLVLNNVITLNILDAVDSSVIGNALDSAVLVSKRLGLPQNKFSANMHVPGKVWYVDGDPQTGIKNIDIPELPNDRYLLKQRLENNIALVSGVDAKYTGRDTGSVQTTGGMDLLTQRLTMSDNTRLTNLQQFIKEVAEIIMSFYLEYGGKRSYARIVDDELDEIITIDFEDFRKEDMKFAYTCNVTPDLPKNVARLADTATQLLEMQMQYGGDPQLITVEEWLAYQDIPQKYHILRRIQQDRMRNDVEDVQADLMNFAAMTQQGMRPEQAVNQLAQERALKRSQPKLGNVAGGSTQAKQS